MKIERKILANLAWRVRIAKRRANKMKIFLGTSSESLYYEYDYAHTVLRNAYNQAKQIYFDNNGRMK